MVPTVQWLCKVLKVYLTCSTYPSLKSSEPHDVINQCLPQRLTIFRFATTAVKLRWFRLKDNLPVSVKICRFDLEDYFPVVVVTVVHCSKKPTRIAFRPRWPIHFELILVWFGDSIPHISFSAYLYKCILWDQPESNFKRTAEQFPFANDYGANCIFSW